MRSVPGFSSSNAFTEPVAVKASLSKLSEGGTAKMPALLSEIKKRADFHAAPFLGTYFLRFNCEKGPFTDPRVRRAFSLVIDKQAIVDRITRAGELPADSFVLNFVKLCKPGSSHLTSSSRADGSKAACAATR